MFLLSTIGFKFFVKVSRRLMMMLLLLLSIFGLGQDNKDNNREMVALHWLASCLGDGVGLMMLLRSLLRGGLHEIGHVLQWLVSGWRLFFSFPIFGLRFIS